MTTAQRDLANLHDHYGPEFLTELATYLQRARLVQQQEANAHENRNGKVSQEDMAARLQAETIGFPKRKVS